ncbi:hypothetical protein D3C86_2227200 [compost metagenome]
MCGELREDHVACGEQLARASDVGHVGVDLAGVNGEVFQTIQLRTLDFRIPVSALDETHHDAAV